MASIRKSPRFAPLVLALLGLILAAPMLALASIDGTVSGAFTANDRRTVGLNTTANLPVNAQPAIAFTNGAGANQAKILYQGNLSLSAGTLNVDLNGVLTDSYGSTVSLVRVKAIYLKNLSSANSMTFGNGTNPWATFLSGTGTITLPPGAWVMAATPDATGWAVTASTGDILKAAGTGTDSFAIVVLGSDT